VNDLVKGLIIYGSPYVLDWFRPFLGSQLPWVFSFGQMPQAQAIACQKLFSLSRNHNLRELRFL
jgi:beta-glucosidase